MRARDARSSSRRARSSASSRARSRPIAAAAATVSQQRRVLVQRGVVDEPRDRLAVALDDRDALLRHLDGLARVVDVGLALGEPERDGAGPGRAAPRRGSSAGARGPSAAARRTTRSWIDGRALQAVAQQADQEGDRDAGVIAVDEGDAGGDLQPVGSKRGRDG